MQRFCGSLPDHLLPCCLVFQIETLKSSLPFQIEILKTKWLPPSCDISSRSRCALVFRFMPSQAQVLWFMDACRSVLNFITLDVFIRAPTYHSRHQQFNIRHVDTLQFLNTSTELVTSQGYRHAQSLMVSKIGIALGRKELKRRMKAYVEHGLI
ncbi:hypothetical protein L1987_84546 [Smallanthus sonchifolius]|uniref:Uncharacterized protein n=1 Tax=Smallanthus sonchifolius TaxID=185202 RepID=A0ACB8YE99_9ASTR|nr:hypothetical protein L1987_84546 [Smallanthus sonchifolius]